MTREPYTRASGEVDIRYVLRTKVDDYVRAADGFLIWLTVTVGFGGAAIAAAIALLAGVRHPEVLYILLSGLVCLTVAFGVSTIRDGMRTRKARRELDENTRSDLALPISVTANAAPAVTYGGLEEIHESDEDGGTEPGSDGGGGQNEQS